MMVNEAMHYGESTPQAHSAVDPAQCGYTAVHNYALYFWRPYLGNTAFSLWELLLSFCYGDRDVAYPSISRLARMLTNSDSSRAVVSGRRRGDGASRPGALDILQRSGLVRVRRRGVGPMSSYDFTVRRVLPLLQPEQVARLSPGLQRDHALWLARHGADDGDTTADGEGSREDAAGSAAADRGSTKNPDQETPWKKWWQDALDELRLQLPHGTFQSCLAGTSAEEFRGSVLTVRARGPLARDVLEHRLAAAVRRELTAASKGQVEEVRFV